jgi:formylglycine-generating enzyme required for sulfatase activity
VDLLPGQSWWAEIKKVLSDPYNLVVVCLSCNSVTKRGVVQREIKRALDVLDEMPEGTIYLIPARLEPCEVPERLAELHWVDLFEPHGFEKLKGALDFEIGRRPPPNEAENKRTQLVWRRWPPIALAGLLVVVVVGLVAVWLSGAEGKIIGTARTPAVVAPPSTETPTLTITPQSGPPTPTVTPKPLTATVVPQLASSTPLVMPTPPTATVTPQAPTPAPTLGPGSIIVRKKDGMEMVYVPGGTFRMGSNEGEDNEQPVHTVTLDSFWIDRTEVTNAQYEHCVADGICRPPLYSGSTTRDGYYGDGQYNDYPVEYVGWDAAKTYCEWTGGRLPTEAEWEYAARGLDSHIYPWGNDMPDDTLANYGGNVGDTTQVGSYPDGASWVGALDMAGNVREWVNDWYADYAASPSKNPTGPDVALGRRVVRGGSWNGYPHYIRSAIRWAGDPDDRRGLDGFRCVVASTSSP